MCLQEAWELQRGTVDPYNVVTTEQFLEDMHHILNDKDLRKKIHSFLPFFFKVSFTPLPLPPFPASLSLTLKSRKRKFRRRQNEFNYVTYFFSLL